MKIRRTMKFAGMLPVMAAVLVLSGCVTTFSDRVCLTWQGDPSTTMTVNFQSVPTTGIPVVYYDTEDYGTDLGAYRFKAEGSTRTIPTFDIGRVIHTVELTGLEPDTAYHFVAGIEGGQFARPAKFRTMPDDDSAIRFIVGGDMAIFPRTRRLMRQSALHEPRFALIGGDLAYANGARKNLWIWERWLHNWARDMVTPEGYLIPMVLAIGNHETNDEYEAPEDLAPYYFGFFAQDEKSYFVRKFGENLVLFILDSGHVNPVDGEQLDWFKSVLEEHADVPFRMAAYHVPLYPSHRSFDDARSAIERELWLPLFDQYELQVCFEHHDHTFKRTHRLRNNEVNESGTVYLGDGCFGVPPREIKNAGAWYLAEASSTPHFWVVDVDSDGFACIAVDQEGNVFDRYPEN